jgi:hypothetical protein
VDLGVPHGLSVGRFYVPATIALTLARVVTQAIPSRA